MEIFLCMQQVVVFFVCVFVCFRFLNNLMYCILYTDAIDLYFCIMSLSENNKNYIFFFKIKRLEESRHLRSFY